MPKEDEMTDIKELALRMAEAEGAKGFHWDGSLFDFVEPFIAAYLAEQKPVAWRTHHDEPMLFPTINEAWQYCEDDEGPEPLFAAPVKDSLTTEPEPSEFSAEQRDKDWSAIKSTAPSSEEVVMLIARLRDNDRFENPDVCWWDRSDAADLIERLAARVPDDRIATLEQQVAALTRERDEREGLVCDQCIDGSGWCENAVEGRYPCTCMTEAEPYQLLEQQLATAQARESKLRDALEAVGRNNISLQSLMIINKALALPTDDSALMERLRQEYERGYADATREGVA